MAALSITRGPKPKRRSAQLLHRPIVGGVFGAGRYALATLPTIAKGLHAVTYMVIDPRAGAVLAVADDKAAALSTARGAIRLAEDQRRRAAQAEVGHNGQSTLFPELSLRAAILGRRRGASRRRRAIFTKSGGRCHYCATTLTLDGRWHIEHQLPRALGGSDEAPNLVAACEACNLAKADRSAIEFVAAQAVDVA